jgi:hypothetical protein
MQKKATADSSLEPAALQAYLHNRDNLRSVGGSQELAERGPTTGLGGHAGDDQRQFEALFASLEVEKGERRPQVQIATISKDKSRYARRKSQKHADHRKVNAVAADKRLRSGNNRSMASGGGVNSVLHNARGRHDQHLSTRLRSAYQTPVISTHPA